MKNILVVEDDQLLGKVLIDALKTHNYNVFWAKQAQEAIEIINNDPINLIFLDVVMPGDMDGFELLRQLKLSEEHRQIPVIMLTNLGSLSDMEKAKDLGAIDYIIKVNIDLKRLGEITKNHLLEDENPAPAPTQAV